MIFIVMQVSLKIVYFTVLTQNMIFIEIVKKSSICVTKNCAFVELIEFYINYIIIANHVDHYVIVICSSKGTHIIKGITDNVE